jgi:hypothetical protein
MLQTQQLIPGDHPTTSHTHDRGVCAVRRSRSRDGMDGRARKRLWRPPRVRRVRGDAARRCRRAKAESEIACVSRGSGGKCLLRCPSLVSAVRELVLRVMRPPPQGRVAACPFPSAPGGPAAHDHSYGGTFVIHEGAGDVKGRLAVFDVRLPAGGCDGRIARWYRGFRGSALDIGVVLPGEVCWVKRPRSGQGFCWRPGWRLTRQAESGSRGVRCSWRSRGWVPVR